MTEREAVKILMMSPFYFRLGLVDRKELVKEFTQLMRSSQNTEADSSLDFRRIPFSNYS